MVAAHLNILEDETPPEGSIIEFMKKMKQVMKIQRLHKSDIVNIRKASFTPFKTVLTSSLEFEYNLDQVARALSENINWDVARFAQEPSTFQYRNYSQPLPLIGHSHNPKVPTPYFFNRDLEYLMYGDTYPKKRYATLLANYPTSIYLLI